MKKLKNVAKNKANSLARRNVSSSNPIPYPCMSASVYLMVGGWIVFSVVVGPILGASIPIVPKLVLRGPAAQPPIAHIHHLAPMRDSSVVHDPSSSGVVSLDGALT
jgi:hypothetical protein